MHLIHLFIFYRYRHLRDLHSFPTRRSSDLPRTPRSRCRPRRPWPGRPRSSAPGSRCRRSEEHTSELQSPYDIVCRLLLEKKKKKTYTIHIKHYSCILLTYIDDHTNDDYNSC